MQPIQSYIDGATQLGFTIVHITKEFVLFNMKHIQYYYTDFREVFFPAHETIEQKEELDESSNKDTTES
uniref:Uncharacterized protein n=1 Tax=viral metagenome TaxID=1070528 RepID=A0A6C0KMP9_9ZZZZ